MPENCRHWQGLLAEHILASHSRAGTDAVEIGADLAEHLAGCADCQAASAEFQSTAAALAGTNAPTSTPVVVPNSDDLSMRITARVDGERRRRDRRRHWMAASAAAVVLLVAASIVTLGHSGSDGQLSEHVALAAVDVHGNATLEAREWGTQIRLAVTGVTPGQRYNVWLERADGSRVGAGTFLGIRNKQIKVVLASALPSAEAIAIGISEPNGDLVVRTPLD